MKRIKESFESTFFPIQPENVNDDLEKIILDADILSSLMFGSKVGVKLAGRLKQEIRYNDVRFTIYKLPKTFRWKMFISRLFKKIMLKINYYEIPSLISYPQNLGKVWISRICFFYFLFCVV